MADPITQRQDLIAALAKDAFAEHQISERYGQGVYRSWRCKRPRGWAYSFDVISEPGRLLVMGDIGTLVLLSGNPDILPWLRGALGDPDYLAGKVAREIASREFDPDIAAAWLASDGAARLRWHTPDWFREVEEVARTHGGPAFFRELHEAGSADPPLCLNFTSGFLWQREALKVFLRLLDQKGVPGA